MLNYLHHKGQMATASEVSRTWKRYFSRSFLARKVREKGIVWCLKAGLKAALSTTGSTIGWPILFVILTPITFLLAAARIRFLTGGNVLGRIGHLAVQPDLYVKSRLVGWRPRCFGILLAPAKSVVNPCLLRYWRPYVTVISHPVLIALLRPFERFGRLQFDTNRYTLPSGSTIQSMPAQFPIQTEYEARYGDQPLLTLNQSDRERGWSCLRKLGVPQDAWFVCLHVREGGYLPDLTYHSFRNADVRSYRPAMEEIVERGGWVIRMGDPTMKPIPPMEQVIDYVHTDARSDWMDVFCFASCQLLIGMASGPTAVSQIFGVPCTLTNWAPMGHGAYSRRDIWIPKLYRSVTENRYLTFEEVLLSPLRGFYRTEDFEAAGVTVVDHSPEEIRDLVVEVMDRMDGKIDHTAEDARLQRAFKSLLEADPMYATNARVGRDFLRKYAWLLPNDTSQSVKE